MQDYIDAQFGGPGKGFYRIVKNPFQARKVINAGKMAVVMGIETSVPFGCTMKVDVPAVQHRRHRPQLDEVRALGVRQMELVNKFDNALSGVAGDDGAIGGGGQRRQLPRDRVLLGHAALRAGGRREPRPQPARGPGRQRRPAGRALRGDRERSGCRRIALPLYPTPDHCNNRGLTTLGEHTIEGAGRAPHDLRPRPHEREGPRRRRSTPIEAIDYPGVVSSHSWSTPDAYPRIYQQGGFITPYAGDSTGFVDKWRAPRRLGRPALLLGHRLRRRHERPRRPGRPARGRRRQPGDLPVHGASTGSPSTGRPPASGPGTSTPTASRSTASTPTGSRTCARSRAPTGPPSTDDMSRGPEAYLQMWERAEGIAPDSCRNPGAGQERAGGAAAAPPRHAPPGP